MKIYLDCLPCALRQVLEATRMATDHPELQEAIIKEAIDVLSNYKNYTCVPEMVSAMHKTVKTMTGVLDPYQAIKERDLNTAKLVYPMLKRFLENKHNELYWALKIASTGNMIDSAIDSNLSIESCIEEELAKEFSFCDNRILEEQLKTATSLLIIGDNAGETIFDRVLIERLIGYEMTYAVRSEPIINDATLQDAYDSGLNDHATIITTGCGAPGAILGECSAQFRSIFRSADVVISKGQGNFEALSDCPRPIFFLLKAKCSMIADKFSVDLNDYVFKHQEAELI